MKFRATFKSLDAIHYALEDVFTKYDEDDNVIPMTDDDVDQYNKCRRLTEKFVQYGELVTIEFDTETGTARVL